MAQEKCDRVEACLFAWLEQAFTIFYVRSDEEEESRGGENSRSSTVINCTFSYQQISSLSLLNETDYGFYEFMVLIIRKRVAKLLCRGSARKDERKTRSHLRWIWRRKLEKLLWFLLPLPVNTCLLRFAHRLAFVFLRLFVFPPSRCESSSWSYFNPSCNTFVKLRQL